MRNPAFEVQVQHLIYLRVKTIKMAGL